MVCLLEHTSDRKFYRQYRLSYSITGLDNHQHMVYGGEDAAADDQTIVFNRLPLNAGRAGWGAGE